MVKAFEKPEKERNVMIEEVLKKYPVREVGSEIGQENQVDEEIVNVPEKLNVENFGDNESIERESHNFNFNETKEDVTEGKDEEQIFKLIDNLDSSEFDERLKESLKKKMKDGLCNDERENVALFLKEQRAISMERLRSIDNGSSKKKLSSQQVSVENSKDTGKREANLARKDDDVIVSSVVSNESKIPYIAVQEELVSQHTNDSSNMLDSKGVNGSTESSEGVSDMLLQQMKDSGADRREALKNSNLVENSMPDEGVEGKTPADSKPEKKKVRFENKVLVRRIYSDDSTENQESLIEEDNSIKKNSTSDENNSNKALIYGTAAAICLVITISLAVVAAKENPYIFIAAIAACLVGSYCIYKACKAAEEVSPQFDRPIISGGEYSNLEIS